MKEINNTVENTRTESGAIQLPTIASLLSEYGPTTAPSVAEDESSIGNQVKGGGSAVKRCSVDLENLFQIRGSEGGGG